MGRGGKARRSACRGVGSRMGMGVWDRLEVDVALDWSMRYGYESCCVSYLLHCSHGIGVN